MRAGSLVAGQPWQRILRPGQRGGRYQGSGLDPVPPAAGRAAPEPSGGRAGVDLGRGHHDSTTFIVGEGGASRTGCRRGSPRLNAVPGRRVRKPRADRSGRRQVLHQASLATGDGDEPEDPQRGGGKRAAARTRAALRRAPGGRPAHFRRAPPEHPGPGFGTERSSFLAGSRFVPAPGSSRRQRARCSAAQGRERDGRHRPPFCGAVFSDRSRPPLPGSGRHGQGAGGVPPGGGGVPLPHLRLVRGAAPAADGAAGRSGQEIGGVSEELPAERAGAVPESGARRAVVDPVEPISRAKPPPRASGDTTHNRAGPSSDRRRCRTPGRRTGRSRSPSGPGNRT